MRINNAQKAADNKKSFMKHGIILLPKMIETQQTIPIFTESMPIRLVKLSNPDTYQHPVLVTKGEIYKFDYPRT